MIRFHECAFTTARELMDQVCLMLKNSGITSLRRGVWPVYAAVAQSWRTWERLLRSSGRDRAPFSSMH